MTAKLPTLPRNNPFPRNQVAKKDAPILRAYYTEVYNLVWARLDDYFLSRPQQEGMAIGIRGSFGSGKTHLVYQLMNSLTKERPHDSKAIYAKAERPDILSFYRNHFAAEISTDDLTNLLAHHLEKIIIDKSRKTENPGPGKKSLIKIAAEQASEHLRNNEPQAVIQLVTEDLLPMSGLQQEMAEELKADSEEPLAEDFIRVYLHLRDANLKDASFRWLTGGRLTDSEQRGLALKSPAIDTAADAMQAMQLLLRVYNKADSVVMFCLDEFERWSWRGTPEDQKLAASLIKDLAETFKNTGQLLVISGVNEAWDSMPKDVFARIKTADIFEMKLTDRDIREILNVYCQSQKTSVLALFESRALSLLSQVSQRNVRQLLNVAHRSYMLAKKEAESQILPAHVKSAALEVLDDADELARVEQNIQFAAGELGLTWRRNGSLGDLHYDYLLEGPPPLQIVIELKRSVFILDEVETAGNIASYTKALGASFPHARYCVVIVGYSTHEVGDALSKIVDRVFYYEKDKFVEELIDYLRLRLAQSTGPGKDPAVAEEVFVEVGEEFDKLKQQRRERVDQINEALTARESELVRLRDADRERRAADRMIETLGALGSLIQSEKELEVRGAGDSPSARGKYERVTQLLDEQFVNIHRAELLNEKLPQAKEFAAELKELLGLTHRAESMWEQSYAQAEGQDFSIGKAFTRSEVRKIFRDRKEILNKLEAMHLRRSARGVGGLFAQLTQSLRRISLPQALVLTSVLLLGLYGIFMYAAWAREKSVLDSYSSGLASVQTAARKIELDPRSRVTNPDSLIESVAQLDEYHSASKTLRYLSVYVPSDQFITYIKSKALSISSGDPTSSDNNSASYARDIIKACDTFRREFASISFYRFTLAYIAANSFEFLLVLAPLAFAALSAYGKWFLKMWFLKRAAPKK